MLRVPRTVARFFFFNVFQFGDVPGAAPFPSQLPEIFLVWRMRICVIALKVNRLGWVAVAIRLRFLFAPPPSMGLGGAGLASPWIENTGWLILCVSPLRAGFS